MILWCLCSTVRVKREDERMGIRWKMWLLERAILALPRLMEEIIKAWGIRGHSTELVLKGTRVL